jgi:hypothetical protein
MQNDFEQDDFDDFGPLQLATAHDEIPIERLQVKNHFNQRLRTQCEANMAIKWHRSRMIAANGGKPLTESQVQELEAYASRVYEAKGLSNE